MRSQDEVGLILNVVMADSISDLVANLGSMFSKVVLK